MGSIIFWGMYILIGFGYAIQNYRDTKALLACFSFFFWPFELGTVLVRASSYYGTRMKIYRVYEEKYGTTIPNEVFLRVCDILQESHEVKLKVVEIEKILHNIENKGAIRIG